MFGIGEPVKAVLRMREHVDEVSLLIADRFVLGDELLDAVVEEFDLVFGERNDFGCEVMLSGVLPGALLALLGPGACRFLRVFAIRAQACFGARTRVLPADGPRVGLSSARSALAGAPPAVVQPLAPRRTVIYPVRLTRIGRCRSGERVRASWGCH